MLWVLKRTVLIKWDGSFEHPKHVLKLMGEKLFKIYAKIVFLNL